MRESRFMPERKRDYSDVCFTIGLISPRMSGTCQESIETGIARRYHAAIRDYFAAGEKARCVRVEMTA